MVQHRLVRVHDAAGKDGINERLIRIEPFITFRGIYDAPEPDRPLLEVKVCMLADTPIARATSFPKSDFDEVIDTTVQIPAQFGVQLMRNRALGSALSNLAATSPCKRLRGSVGLCAAYAASKGL
jgi:hypothetical protein